MGQVALSIPVVNQPNSTEDPKVSGNFNVLQTLVNGNIDLTNLSAGAIQALQASTAPLSTHTFIATTGTRTNTAYGFLSDASDQAVIVLAANGVIQVRYQATWQESVSGAARAAIFVGANQFKAAVGSAIDIGVQEAGTGNDTAATNNSLTSSPIGLISGKGQFHSGDVATGQALGVFAGVTTAFVGGLSFTGLPGGVCEIIGLPAGAYTIAVQFKASSGTVTASNRKLWLQALPF